MMPKRITLACGATTQYYPILILALLFLFSSSVAFASDLDEIRAAIKEKGANWTADHNSKSDLTKEEKKHLCGAVIPSGEQNYPEESFLGRVKELPAKWDWRNVNETNWVTPVKDQASCGSCWAFGAIGAMESDIMIALGNTSYVPDLSEQHLVSECCPAGDCNGGWHTAAYDYIMVNGVPDEACYPYEAINTPCEPCEDWQLRTETLDSWVMAANNPFAIEEIKSALYFEPLATYLLIYDDFFYYTGGVYVHTYGELAGAHLVTLVGWDNNLECWICKNSWGEGWGDNGYFKIKWGEVEIGSYTTYVFYLPNDCQVNISEDLLKLSYPGSSNCTYPSTVQLYEDHAACDDNIIWSSSDENVITVSDNGLVTAKGMGSAKIFAQCPSSYNCLDTCSVVVFYCDESTNFWEQTFGDAADNYGQGMQQTSDGGFIMTGFTMPEGKATTDLLLIKTDAEANQIWQVNSGGAENDYGSAVMQTPDGGFVVVGDTSSYGAGESDFWLLKFDANGNELWQKTFGGTEPDKGSSLDLTDDGGIIMTGYTDSYGAGKSDLWLIKTDADGNELWSKTFGASGYDKGQAVKTVANDGFIIAGYTTSYAGKANLWLVKTDANGTEEWSHYYGGSDDEWGFSVTPTADHGFAAAGYTKSYGAGKADGWLIKVDSAGNELWNQTYGGAEDDYFRGLIQSSDNSYVLVGYTKPAGGGNPDIWLVNANSEGSELWSKTFGGPLDDFGRAVLETTDRGYAMLGYTNSYGSGGYDLWLLYYKQGVTENQPPYSPTLIAPENGSTQKPGAITFSWINNGDPDNDAVGSWLYVIGAWGQTLSMDMGAAGFTVGEEISYTIPLMSAQDWAWSVYIYDPNYNSDPHYAFQQPFWHFTISS